MAKETVKKDPGYDVVSDIEAEKIAIDELKKFRKGFGIEMKTFETETSLPEHLKGIIEQYYTVALVMIPNCSMASFPYDSDKSGATFIDTRNSVYNRCQRVMDELSLIISMYKRRDKVTTDKSKRICDTFIKLLETDAINNIAHMYDVEKETGTKIGRNNVYNFYENFSSNEHLYLPNTDERVQKTRLMALNKFIRNSLTHLYESLGIPTPKTIDLKSFSDAFVLGARASLLNQKSNGIRDLLNGDYDVTPIVVRDRQFVNNITQNQDMILFLGKGNISAVTRWHLGASGALSDSQELSKVKKYDVGKVKSLIEREMPNFETIRHSANLIFGEKETGFSHTRTSILDKLMEYRAILIKGKLSKDNAVIDACKSRLAVVKKHLKNVNYEDDIQVNDMLETAKVKEIASKFREVPI